jgi:hypothetical protein
MVVVHRPFHHHRGLGYDHLPSQADVNCKKIGHGIRPQARQILSRYHHPNLIFFLPGAEKNQQNSTSKRNTPGKSLPEQLPQGVSKPELYRQMDDSVPNGCLKKNHLTIQQYNILHILRGQIPAAATIKLARVRMLDRISDTSRTVELLRKRTWRKEIFAARTGASWMLSLRKKGSTCSGKFKRRTNLWTVTWSQSMKRRSHS